MLPCSNYTGTIDHISAAVPTLLIFTFFVFGLTFPRALPGGSVYYFCAMLIVIFVVQILKNVFGILTKDSSRTQRPKKPIKGRGRGMPSSHIALLTFVSVTFAFQWFETRQPSILIVSSLWIITVIVALSRCHSRRHSSLQVCAGGITGFIFALVYTYMIPTKILSLSPT